MTVHSRLIQTKIGAAFHADREFTKGNEDNSEIPIVLIPHKHCLPTFQLNVPSGMFVLYQKWNANQGLLEPGVKWMWLPWYRISHMVTKSVVSYNAPAKNCPTADNIMVNVDLSLTFQIGPDEEAVTKFVYGLGAYRLDELLSAEAEEAIRALVYSVTHDEVDDLREEFAKGMLSTLNSKINCYGVRILHVKITNVVLPQELQDRLEKTTGFKTKLGEEEKNHENRVRVFEDEATKGLEIIRKTNAREIQMLKAEQNRYCLERQDMEERARGNAKVQEIESNLVSALEKKKVAGNETVQVLTAERKAEELIKNAELEILKIMIQAQQKADTMVVESEALIDVAESKAGSMISKARAEADGAEALSEKRRFELEWSRLEVLKKIAGNGRRFITGEVGEELLSDLVPVPKQ